MMRSAVALGVEVGEVELADGLEGLGELRVEAFLDGVLVAGPLGAGATLMTSSTVLLTRMEKR
ncbi:hypothetical protein OURE66S_03454 [Oligella ureolytica]